jgi:peptidoglycan hydrolase-like protein with peptidoglycan-binding domain
MKRKVLATLAAAVLSLTIGLAGAGTAAASTATPGAVSADSCNTWATGSWADNCQVALGSSSNMVLAVQWIVSGACGGSGLTLDGIFGSNTQHAVECFQSQQGLSVDGIVGPDTWTALQNSLEFDPPEDAGWDYYYPTLYDIYSGDQVFRKWDSSGRWYVAGVPSGWVSMTS